MDTHPFLNETQTDSLITRVTVKYILQYEKLVCKFLLSLHYSMCSSSAASARLLLVGVPSSKLSPAPTLERSPYDCAIPGLIHTNTVHILYNTKHIYSHF